MQPFFFTEIQNAIDEKKKNQGEITEWTSRRKERETGGKALTLAQKKN